MICGFIGKVNQYDERNQVQRSSLYKDCPIVLKPQIHLGNYAKRYTNVSRLIRLKFIAQVCPTLRVEALEMAIGHVKSTYNVKMYKELHSALCKEMERCTVLRQPTTASTSSFAAPSTARRRYTDSGVPNQAMAFDPYWVENNTMEAALLRQELDAELNFKKTSSGTTYVRRILEEIGDYHVDCGNLQLAVKFYARARSYCTSSEHVINMFRNLIRVSIYMANWWHVLSYIEEAKQYAAGFPNLARQVPIRLSCAAGLANMGLKIYKTSAECFVLTPYESYDYDNIVAAEDVAYFGGLSALATLEMDELQSTCLHSKSFKHFLDHSPKMWTILATFMAGDYNRCNLLLNEIEDQVRLDVYLAPHVDSLYDKITTRIREKIQASGVLMVISSNSTLGDDEMETEVIAKNLYAD